MDSRSHVAIAAEKVNGIAPSVIALAVTLGVQPKNLAKNLVNSKDTVWFMTALLSEVARLQVEEETKEA